MLKPYPWQKSQWRRLVSAADRDRLAHALLFSGADGLGIGDFALALAARLLCERPDTDGACGACRSCQLLQAGNHPDLSRVAPEESGKAIRVEAVRDMIEYSHLSSQYGRYKIVIIEPADAMNRHAANTLLKTLEEPPPQSILILISAWPSLLPVTIRSRCQQVGFAAPATENIQDWLAGELASEPQRAGELLAMAGNRPLAALELEEEGTLERQAAVLADLERMRQRPADPVAMARQWLEHGAVEVMQWLLAFIRIMGRQKLSTGPQVSENRFYQDLNGLASGLDLLQLFQWYDIVLRNYRAASGPFNLNQQGLLEDIIVNWQSLSQTTGRSRQ